MAVIDVRKFVGRVCAIAAALVLSVPVALAQPIFSTASSVPLAGTPGDALPILSLADVGSSTGGPDGKLDIITALQGPMTAYVFFGQGNGTFPSDNGGTALNRIPTAMLVDDIDTVAGKDLVVADTASVAFMHGNNNGSFDPPDPTPAHKPEDRANWICAGHTCAAPVGAQVVALAAADVDGNGKADVVVIDNAGQGGVMVLLGDGNGNLTPGNPVAAPGLWAVATGDFNNDGSIDLAVTNRNNNSVSILRGNGTGAFTSVQTLTVVSGAGGDPVAISSGELNGDGKPDLVVANETADNIAVFLTQADGSFQAAQFYETGTKGSGPNGVTLAHVNPDTSLDAVVSNGSSSDVSTLLGDGTGRFGTPRAFVADQEPQTVAAADVNGDGFADAVAITQDGDAPSAMVLRGNGDGSYAAVENAIVPPSPKMAVAGDVDNDGLPDLIVVPTTPSGQSGTVLIRRALATGGFAAPVVLQSHGDVISVATGDFNGDGLLDVVALNGSSHDMSLFLATAVGLPSTPTQNMAVATGAVGLLVGDWDRNGLPDLAIVRRSSGAGAIDVLVSTGDGNFQAKPLIALASEPQAIDFGDFNKDGILDLVVANGGASTLTFLRGNGDATFQTLPAVTIPGVTTNASSLAAADFDGNGTDDVAILVAGSSPRVRVLYGPDFTTASDPLIQSFPPSALAARDLTGDLVPDLLVTNQGQSNSVVAYRYTKATKTFTKAQTVTVGRMPASLATADFDGDGRYDAATANDQFAGTVSVLTNIDQTNPAILRGDGNGDGKLSAADLVAVARKLHDGASTRVETLAGAVYPNTTAGADANGDSVVTGQDIFAIAYRLFPQM